ncbi:MAG: protein kinase [Sandaracinaceae bacterium]|nr:protein kinase [Sandaracinaceae bacterium]
MHPSSETLARFVEGTLSEQERDSVTAELAQCAECRAVVGALARRPAQAAIPRTHEGREEEAPASARGPGATIGGRYRVVRQLGEGGMGVVYEVEHALFDKHFALKTLHAALAARGDAVRRFLGEARALASLGHEGIVEVVDMGSDEAGTPFLVMPMLVGETLEDRLEREGRLDVELALEIGEQIARALAFAHARGVVHRDIKPANVYLLAASGAEALRVKILDFGIAKLLDPDATRTGSGVMLGTPRYMAPEQWTRPRDVDARADVFAWGVTLHRMLTGDLPYAWGDVMEARSELPAPDVRGDRPEVPIAFAAIVERASSLAPSRRFADAGELAAALAAVRPQRGSVRPSGARAPIPAEPRTIAGREAELAHILSRLDAGAAVVITGVTGIGKSALLDELARVLVRSGRATAIARRQGDPHAPFAILRSILGATVRDPAGRREDALALALRAELRREGLVLLVDDADALDAASHTLLRAVRADGSVGPRLVLTASEARADELARAFDAEIVVLRGLDAEGVRSLMRAHGPVDDRTLSELLGRTAGHPLFVLQCLALEAASPVDPDDALTSPRALGDAVLSRLEAAPDHAAIAWQIAAVLADAPGAGITAGDLAALGASRAEEALAWLRDERIVAESRGVHRFVSELLASVALSTLGESERAALHAHAARLKRRGLVLESEPARWAELAHHLERAGEHVPASDAFARAALGAGAIALEPSGESGVADSPRVLGLRQDLAFETAVAWATRALELAARAGRKRSDAADLALVEIEALEARGRFAEVVTQIEALRPTLEGSREARALVHLGTALQRGGEAGRALSTFEEAVAIARASHDELRDAVLARALGRRAVALVFAGRTDEARDVLDEAEPLVLTRAPDLRPDLAGWRAQIAALSGDLAERREAYWAAEELFRASGNVRFAAFSLLNLGDTYAHLGAYAEAERALVKAHAECDALGATVMTGYAAINLAQTTARMGRIEDALRWLARASEIASKTAEPRLVRYGLLYAAQLAVMEGADALMDVEGAIAALDRLVPSSGLGELDASFLVSALTVLARAELQRARRRTATEPLTRAAAHAERARAILEDAGGLEEGEAELHLVLADVLEALGEERAAREVLRDGARRLKQAARRIGGALFRGHYLEDVAAHRELLSRAG